MAIRYYFVPEEFIGLTHRGPKYFKWGFPGGSGTGSLIGKDWQDYGNEKTFFVIADLSAADHSTLVANADVITLPINIDKQVTSGALAKVKADLEFMNIPGNWVTTAYTYRNILRKILVVFSIMQRFNGLAGTEKLFATKTLSTEFRDLSAKVRTALKQSGDEMGFDTAGLTGASTVRQILKSIADQKTGPVRLGDMEV